VWEATEKDMGQMSSWHISGKGDCIKKKSGFVRQLEAGRGAAREKEKKSNTDGKERVLSKNASGSPWSHAVVFG